MYFRMTMYWRLGAGRWCGEWSTVLVVFYILEETFIALGRSRARATVS